MCWIAFFPLSLQIACLVAMAGSIALGDEPPAANAAAPKSTGTKAGQVRDDNGLKMKFVWCPAGTFTMGSPTDERDRQENEAQVQVTLTKGFWLGKYEVTQSEWQRVMRTAPWVGKEWSKDGGDCPATYVSWDEASKFCQKLTETERGAGRLPAGWRYTLPTEAQWEYACRAGVKSRFSFGDDKADLTEYAWFELNSWAAGEAAHPVGQKRANRWGLHDMHGNVREWCRDVYALELPGGTDPEVAAGGAWRVYRGGSWRSVSGDCRSAERYRLAPGFRSTDLGFRVALCPSVK